MTQQLPGKHLTYELICILLVSVLGLKIFLWIRKNTKYVHAN